MLNCFIISDQTTRPDYEFWCLILQNVAYNFTKGVIRFILETSFEWNLEEEEQTPGVRIFG